jgi:dGTPase
MDWADDVTYAVHDLEDFHRSGLIPFGVLAGSQAEQTRFAASFDATTARGKQIRRLPGVSEAVLSEAIGYVVNYVAAQLRQPFDSTILARAKLREIASELIGRFMSSADPSHSPSNSDPRLLVIDARDRALVEVLQQLTWYYVIERPALASLQAGQLKVIENLYEYYFQSIEKRPRRRSLPAAQQIALEEAEDESGRVRVIVDYIAGMTDARALALNGRLLGLSPGSLLDPIANELKPLHRG